MVPCKAVTTKRLVRPRTQARAFSPLGAPAVSVGDPDPPLQPRRIALAYLAGTTLSPATRAFIAAAIDVADNLSHA